MNKHHKITALEGTDFQLVSQEAVNEVVIRRNSTPRKVLGYQTPSEVFTAHIMQGVRIET
jgi:IS30 family transposase